MDGGDGLVASGSDADLMGVGTDTNGADISGLGDVIGVLAEDDVVCTLHDSNHSVRLLWRDLRSARLCSVLWTLKNTTIPATRARKNQDPRPRPTSGPWMGPRGARRARTPELSGWDYPTQKKPSSGINLRP